MRHCKGNCTSAYVCGTVCVLLTMKYMPWQRTVSVGVINPMQGQ